MKIPFNICYKSDIISRKMKVVTRDGRPVDILKWNADNDNYPIVGTIKTGSKEEPYNWTADGRTNIHADYENPGDLYIVKRDPKFHVNDVVKYHGDKYLIKGIGDDWYDVNVVLNVNDDFIKTYCMSIGFENEDLMKLVDEPKLNEFEKRLKMIVNAYGQRVGEPSNIEFISNEGAKKHAKYLLDAIDSSILDTLDKAVEAEVMYPASSKTLQVRYKLPKDTMLKYGDKVKIIILQENK